MDIDEIDRELHRRLQYLLAATRVWSRGGEFAEQAVAQVRRQALLLNHRRYVELIPFYRRLAESAGLVEVSDLRELVAELMLTCEVFKSYDATWLESGDFAAMTDWLGAVFLRRPRIRTDDVGGIFEWRRRLLADGVHLQHSTGTSGRLSIVPRDPVTLAALRYNGRCYPHPSQADLAADGAPFDALLLVPRGDGTGLQGVASGLVELAGRCHRLDDRELTVDMIQAHVSGVQAGPLVPVDRAAAHDRCVAFLRRAVSERRRVLVFGPPFAVHALVTHVLAGPGGVELAPGSTVVTGGGWKGLAEVSVGQLRDVVRDALGVPPSHLVDVYSTVELNAALMTCVHGRYHVPPLLEPCAVDDALFAQPGDDVTGTLAFLDPFAASYPGFLVTGDHGRLVHGRCECGLEGWSVIGPITRPEHSGPKGCAGVTASLLA